MQSAQRQGRSPCKRREYRCCYGKGIALMFKEMFPANFRAYEAACKAEQLHVGRMFVTENPTSESPRWIINFPTRMATTLEAGVDYRWIEGPKACYQREQDTVRSSSCAWMREWNT